jgi:hypothetical protein
LPVLDNIFDVSPDLTGDEKRLLAPFPEISLKRRAIKKFPARFEAFFNDHFGFRTPLIRFFSWYKINIFGISPSSKVIFGKDGWLFFAGDKTIDDYRCIKPLTKPELIQWQKHLEQKQKWLAKQGKSYFFVVAPNKHSIYPEFLPDHVNRVGKESRLDQLIKHLGENTDINIIDLREDIISAKNEYVVYKSTDTHWNDLGAFIAYRKIMKQLKKYYNDLDYHPLSQFEIITKDYQGTDLISMLGTDSMESGQTINLVPKFETCAKDIPYELKLEYKWSEETKPFARACDNSELSLLMFRDSFASALEPYLSEHFKKSIYVWTFAELNLIKLIVMHEKPDIVIEERVERGLGIIPKSYDLDF